VNPDSHPLTLAALLDSRYAADRLTAAGMTAPEARAKGDRFARCAQALLDRDASSNDPAVAVFVPGRIEVLGKHTDYCGGRSLLCTVERGMCFVAAARPDPILRFVALDLNDQAEMAIDPNLAVRSGHWANYPMTVARRLARNFPAAATGADVAVSSDLPPASGLSSSSAMIVGCFLLLSRLNRLETMPAYRQQIGSRAELAGYLGCIENGHAWRDLPGDRGVGTHGGSQDHTAILCCKPGRLSVFSFAPVRHELDLAFPEDLAFVIANSGVVAEKTGAAQAHYNLVSQRAGRIVELWNARRSGTAKCLRDVVEHQDDGFITILKQDDREGSGMNLVSRWEQFVAESRRIIPDAVSAIHSQDWGSFGHQVAESQSLAATGLMNQTEETLALSRALTAAGAIAASPFGAGFGGSVWGLFSKASLAPAMTQIANRYDAFATRPSCPALEII
jgi:galactokinase